MARIFASISACVLLFGISLCLPAFAQGAIQLPKAFPLLNFDEVNRTCRAKGRLQDKEYCDSKTMDQIIAGGKASAPILISQLTDTRPLKEPIFDYWNRMTVGDVAAFVLQNLFTDSDWRTFTVPGIDEWRNGCGEQNPAEVCWEAYVKKHGRTYIQAKWQSAWIANKDRLYWDESARCFRLRKLSTP
jgi:hypothetical protein